MLNPGSKSNSGFSFFEVLTAITLGAMLLLALISGFTGLIKTQRRLLSINRLETTSARMLTRLQNDIRWAVDARVEAGGTRLIVNRNDGQRVIYAWSRNEGRLTREEIEDGGPQMIHPQEIVVSDFEVRSERLDGDFSPLVHVLIGAKVANDEVTNIVLEKDVTFTVKRQEYAI